MAVAYCILDLRLPENGSLKGKRQVIRSVTERVKNRYNVSIAEIDHQDSWQMATLGIAYVNSDGGRCRETLEQVVGYIQDSRLDAELLNYTIETIDG